MKISVSLLCPLSDKLKQHGVHAERRCMPSQAINTTPCSEMLSIGEEKEVKIMHKLTF